MGIWSLLCVRIVEGFRGVCLDEGNEDGFLEEVE